MRNLVFVLVGVVLSLMLLAGALAYVRSTGLVTFTPHVGDGKRSGCCGSKGTVWSILHPMGIGFDGSSDELRR
jgi:hypothetical protein